MPTKKQLSIMRESQFEFPQTRSQDDPMYVKPKSMRNDLKGRIVGHIIYDPASKGLRIIAKNNT